MKETLLKIKTEAIAALAQDGADIEALRIKYLGNKGELTAGLRGMGKLSAEERPVIGQLANDIRAEIEAEIRNAVNDINRALPSFKHMSAVEVRREEFEKTSSKKIKRYLYK